MSAGSEITETLYVCREVKLYKIPARLSSGGHKSGEWQVSDNIFTGKLRIVAIGALCKIILEDANGEEFASCLVPEGERSQAVEPVTDSSRYFVLRLIDPKNPKHRAFLGLGFTDRAEAFDFNVALSDHEKHLQRAKDAKKAAQLSSSGSSQQAPIGGVGSEVANMYQSRDLSLKEGETIKINIKRSGSAGSRRAAETSHGTSLGTLPAMPARPTAAPPTSTKQAEGDLLGLLSPPPPGSTVKPGNATENWATF